MLKTRIIPCLDVADGRVVKGVNFVGLRDAGDPVESAKAYDAEPLLHFRKKMRKWSFIQAPNTPQKSSTKSQRPLGLRCTTCVSRSAAWAVDSVGKKAKETPLPAPVPLRHV